MCSFLVFGTGCMTAAKRVIKEAKGASSETTPVSVKGRYANYAGVTIAPTQSELGRLVPAAFKKALGVELRKALVTGEEALFKGKSPNLKIEPHVMWFHEASTVGGIVGSDSYVVVLFKFSADGADAGKLQIVTSTAASRTGYADMAASMAGELADWFEEKRGKK